MPGARSWAGVKEIGVIRVATGASIADTLSEWADARSARAGTVQAIGAAYDVELGYFHRDRREYSRYRVPGEVEIVSLQGNLARKGTHTIAHLHAAVSAPDGTMTGGHFFDGRAGATCEIVVTVFDGVLDRSFDPTTGLWLLDV